MSPAIKPAILFGKVYFPTFTPVNYKPRQKNDYSNDAVTASLLWNPDVWHSVTQDPITLSPIYTEIPKPLLDLKFRMMQKNNKQGYEITLSKLLNLWIRNFYFEPQDRGPSKLMPDAFLKVDKIPIIITNEEDAQDLSTIKRIFTQKDESATQEALEAFFVAKLNPKFFLHKNDLFKRHQPHFAKLQFNPIRYKTITEIINQHNAMAGSLQTPS